MSGCCGPSRSGRRAATDSGTPPPESGLDSLNGMVALEGGLVMMGTDDHIGSGGWRGSGS